MAYNPPTFVASYTTVYNTTTTPKTVSVTTQAGDVVVVYAAAENNNQFYNTISGNSISFTQKQLVDIAGWTQISIWTGTDNTGGTNWTLSVSRTGSGQQYGITCLVFRGSDGVGASSKTNNNPGPSSLGLTTTQDNSAIVVIDDDWDAGDGSTRTWRTVNGITPTSGNGLETTYAFSSGFHTVYGAYYNDAGTAGSKTLGLTAPTQGHYAIAAVEVKGTQATVPPIAMPWVGM